MRLLSLFSLLSFVPHFFFFFLQVELTGVTAFSLMSYDFNSAQPGPNAPLWSLSVCTSLSLSLSYSVVDLPQVGNAPVTVDDTAGQAGHSLEQDARRTELLRPRLWARHRRRDHRLAVRVAPRRAQAQDRLGP